MGRGSTNNSRGNAYLVGVVLLVGLTLSAAVIILVVGQGQIQDTNQQSNVELAGQMFQGEFGSSGSEQSSVDVPRELQGKLELNEDTEYRLRVNGDPECASGHRPLGTMQYETDDGTLVGYEGGGVWENTEGSASMRSPPAFTYDNGSLSLGFPNVSGSITDSDQITADANESRRAAHDRNFSQALYTDLDYGESGDPTVVCPPRQLDNGTLWINDSQFAPAWVNYFQNNYNEPYVAVQNPDSVEPGDDVKVTLLLGDVSNPDYEIRYVDYEYDSGADELVVDAKINNSGGIEGDQTASFSWTHDSGATGSESRDVALGSNENVTETFRIPSPSAGTYKITVATENESRRFPVAVDSAGGAADLRIQDTSAPANATSGSDADVTVTLENVGGLTANRTVTYEVTDTDTGAVVRHEERNVSLNVSAGPTDMDFDVDTTVPGKYAWRVEAGGDSASGHIVVGSRPYFRVASVTSPTSVDAYNPYELEAEIQNTGHLSGEMPVSLVVEDATGTEKINQTTTLELDGTENTGGSTSATLSLTNSFTADEQGQYRYVVETPNSSQTGAFVVGEPDHPVFAVEDVTLSPRPGEMTTDEWMNVTVENVGSEPDRQAINATAPDGAVLWSEPVTLAPGERYTVRKRVTLSRTHFENETYNELSFATENTTWNESLYVEPFESVESCETGICAEEEINAEISVLGAELEGRNDGILSAPVQMRLQVEEDGSTTTTELWRDMYNHGDVNHPKAERTMVQDDDPYNPAYDRNNPYKYNLTLDEGSRISVFARSEFCAGTDPTDVVWHDIEYYSGWFTDVRGYECGYGGERLDISQTENTDNVVILKDGQDVPSFGAAESYQRGLEGMLGSRITSNGTLNLAPGERVFLYELSAQNADPANAGGSGDPDYNDAVALFRTTSVERNNPEPELTIVDADVPTSLDEGYSDETATVTVENVGNASGRSNVTFALAGSESSSHNVHFEPGERRTLTFDVPEGKPPDTYPYYVDVRRHSTDSLSGYLTVGSPDQAYFQISSVSAPSVVGEDATPNLNVTVTNTGSVAGSQQIEVHRHGTVVDSTLGEIHLDPGESRGGITLQLPMGSPNGTVDYAVRTENMSTGTRDYYVGTSRARIDQAIVGTTAYGENELIERRQLDAMSVKLVNTGTIGDDRDVTLDIDNDDGTNAITPRNTSVGLGSGRIYSTYPNWVTFENINGSGLSTGYYDYTITVSDSSHPTRTWEGRMYITEDADVSSTQNSSSPISVDSSQVVVG